MGGNESHLAKQVAKAYAATAFTEQIAIAANPCAALQSGIGPKKTAGKLSDLFINIALLAVFVKKAKQTECGEIVE
ncbi:MAG: hypothetical protein Q4A29_10535 [Eubacteriales bacterium]|nr:hypothetical protein [Eubacteriales bacterium]